MKSQSQCQRLRRPVPCNHAGQAGADADLRQEFGRAPTKRRRKIVATAERRRRRRRRRLMQLTRWNPFVEIDDIQNRLNRLFIDKAVKPSDAFADFMPAVDIQETDNEFIVKADLPDVKKEDVKVHLQDGVLAIEGERRQEKEEKGRRFHRVERDYGKFVRRFAMPIEIDPEKVRAEFKEGVLNVVLPKAPAAKPKVIDVKLA
jgi:HSP20 family protein